MSHIAVPDFGKKNPEPILSVENLEFHSGNSTFTKEAFVDAVAPYFEDLKRVGRIKYLCAFTYGDGEKTDVTGYRTDTTLNVTNNSKILKSKSTGGNWVVYQLNS